jgi:hypothetical protein
LWIRGSRNNPAHINDENLYRNVFITSFGGMCVCFFSFHMVPKLLRNNASRNSSLFLSTMLQRFLVFFYLLPSWTKLGVLHQLHVYSSPHVLPNRSADNPLLVRCTGLHLCKFHYPAHLRPRGLLKSLVRLLSSYS